MKEIGLNLYSIRNLIQNESDFRKTLITLKEGGYTYIQLSGCPLDYSTIKKITDKVGMPIKLTHVPLQRLKNDLDNLIKDHELLNCPNIGLGAYITEVYVDKDLFRSEIEQLEKIAEKIERAGFKFFYHNHHNEFFKHDGQTNYDYIIENAPHVHFTFDTYWVQYGGVDLYEYMNKIKGRMECVHLKDYEIVQKTENGELKLYPRYAPIGDGNINFKNLVVEMKKSGVENFIVEQDNAALLPDTLAQVLKSAKYIKENL